MNANPPLPSLSRALPVTPPMSTTIKSAIKSLVAVLGIEYAFYRIYRLDLTQDQQGPEQTLPPGYSNCTVDASTLKNAKDALIRDQAWYGGSEALGFAVLRDGDPVCVQWIWHGDRYRTKRGFWPLEACEAKSVQLVTVEAERGRGLATQIKQFSAGQLKQLGFERIYSRIWWSNAASIRVSEKSGWIFNSWVGLVRIGKGRRSLKIIVNKDVKGLAVPRRKWIDVSLADASID